MTTKIEAILRDRIDYAFTSTPSARISPVIVTRDRGSGVLTAVRSVAADSGRLHVDLRVAMMDETDFSPLPVLHEGVIEQRKPSIAELRNALVKGCDVIVTLDEAVINGATVATAILNQAQDEAVGRVVVLLLVTDAEREQAAEAVRAMRMPTAMAARFDTVDLDAVALLENYLAYARKSGVDGDVIDYLEKGGLRGVPPKGWTLLSNMLSSEEVQALEIGTRQALYDQAVGAQQAFGFLGWKAAKAAQQIIDTHSR